MDKKSILILVSSLCLSCGNESHDQKLSKPVTLNDKEVRSLTDSAILIGDTVAYDAVAAHYFISNKNSEFLTYALLMAHKHNYRKAFFDVYFVLTHPVWGEGISNLDIKTRRMASYYLTKSYRLGDNEAIEEVENLSTTTDFVLVDSL